MDLAGVPSAFREHVSDDGRQVVLAGMQLTSVPDWLSSLTALTELDLRGNRLESVPEWLGDLTALTALNLWNNQLASVPDSLGDLTALTRLNLGLNRLTSVPERLGDLSALTTLNLWGNQLASVPDSLGNLAALTRLDLRHNRLASVPESLGDLAALTTLNLLRNQLASVPDSLGNLSALTALNLSGNRLASVPESFGGLAALTSLNLTYNHMASIPEAFGNLTALKSLNLSFNEAASVPESLGNLMALTSLNLSGNQLTSVPESLRNLTALTELNLRRNQLTSVPESLRSLAALTDLNLRRNQLTSIPEWLGNLTALTTLDLSGNRLTLVPESLGDLAALTTLNLWGNQLPSVPESFGNLTALTTLNLNRNRLVSVPERLGSLTSLTVMDLSGNQLPSLPESLGNLSALTTLNLSENQLTALPVRLADLLTRGLELRVEGNPLADPLLELAARGAVELATYLHSLYDAEPLYEAKLLVVGEGTVGKTSLIAARQTPAPFVEGRSPTHGIEITPLTIRNASAGRDITVRAWDFGGQEVYRITHQFFYTLRALYLVAWNARQGQEHDEVEGWLRRIRLRVGQEARAVLVATHCSEGRPELDYPHLERVFPGMLAGAFETDSQTGLGIDELRRVIGEEATRLPQMGQLWSPRWVAAREEILVRGETEPHIWYTQFAAVCKQHGLSQPETRTLAKLMHDLGLIVYYSDDEGLRDIVVLNPEWLTKAISQVLEDPATRQAEGILDHARLRRILGDLAGYEPRYHPYFLRLMEKFDISYRIEGDETRSLVTQLVPHQRPSLDWQQDSKPPAGTRTLTLLCRMSEPAPGLIPWLTVRHHRDSTGIYWRRGVFLRHRISAYHSEALIELHGNTELAVQVRAPSPDLYFNVLRDSIEDLITRRWPGLGYRLYIPCPGMTADEPPCTGVFPLDGLVRQREGGQATVACMDCPATPDISILLTGFAGPSVPLAAELERVNSRLATSQPASPASRGRQHRSPTPSGACTRSWVPKSLTAPACSPSPEPARPE